MAEPNWLRALLADVKRLRDGSYAVSYPETTDGIEYAIVWFRLNKETGNYTLTCIRCDDATECADIEAVKAYRRQAFIQDDAA